MPTDFEQRLREGMQARAAEIKPDPETWNRVQEGIRRTQRFRWGYAGVATAALAAFAFLVVPGLLSGPDVTFDPGPGMAEQPAEPGTEPEAGAEPEADSGPAPDGAVGPPPVDVVVSAGAEIALVGPEVSRSLGSVGSADVDVAVHPASTGEAVDAVAASGCSLSRVTADAAGSSIEVIVEGDEGACASGPRFSPDGGHLAWIETGGGNTIVRTLGWDEGPVEARNAQWPNPAAVGDLVDVRVAGWSWTGAEDGTTTGFLVLSGVWTDGRSSVSTLSIEEQPDGALALPGGDEAGPFDSPGQRVLAFQHAPCAEAAQAPCPDAVAWTLEQLDDGPPRLVRSDEGEELRTYPLAGDWLRGADPATGPVWLDVVGDTAVLGDGAGHAWALTWMGEDTWDVVEIAPGAGVVHGAALHATADQPAPTLPAPPPASEEEQTEPEEVEEPAAPESQRDTTSEPLPAPVERTRGALIAAAETGDLENLRPLLPSDDDGFTFSYGADADPIAFWRDRQAEGEDILGLLRRLLELPPVPIGEDVGFWAWPFAFERTYESLASAEHVALEAAIGPRAMADYEAHGTYLHYRIGIDRSGTWRYFVAGD